MFIIDPKNGKPSVSLTLMLISAIYALTISGFVAFGKVEKDNADMVMEIMITFVALYFSRKVSLKGKNFELTQEEKLNREEANNETPT